MSVIGITWAGVATALAVGSAVVSIGGKIREGFKAQDNASVVADAKDKAGEYRDAKIGMTQKTHGITTETLDLTADTSVDKSGQTAHKNITDLVDQVNTVTGKSNMASNTTIDRIKGKSADSIYSAYDTSTKAAIDSRNLGFRTADITRDSAIADEELDYATRMADIENQPDEFWEGFYA